MKAKLENKTILLVGASRGIGKAILDQLSDINCTVYALSRNIDSLKSGYGNCKANIKIHACDVTNKEEITSAWNTISGDNPIFDFAILNAGFGTSNFPDNFDSGLVNKTINTNFMGPIYFIEKLLPGMIERKSGYIAVTSSIADVRGFAGSAAYCASKAALTTFMEALGTELKPYNVKVGTIRPGFVKTDMTAQNKFDMPFLMLPERAASIILKNVAKQKRMISFPWQMNYIAKLALLLPTTLLQKLSKSKI